MPEITFKSPLEGMAPIKWRMLPNGRMQRLDADGVWREPPPSELRYVPGQEIKFEGVKLFNGESLTVEYTITAVQEEAAP